MDNWKKKISQLTNKAEDKIDSFAFNLRKRLNLYQPLQITPYRSYGTTSRLYVKGRLLANKNIRGAMEHDNLWDNLLNMYRRFETDEIPGAQIGLRHNGELHTITTDSEGYFTLNLEPHTPLELQDIWHTVALELLDAPVNFEENIIASAQVLVPPPDAEYGIISDIDDTIVKTGATDMLAMARNVFMNNARTRLPFAGVSEFYKSLQLGRNGKRNNPFFYVSSSPWNMYDLLHDFLDLNEIPAGPLLLRDFGLDENKFIQGGHLDHKFKEIENILLTYPTLPFVLIGDSGQQDAPIYREIVKKYPTRILAVYIRDVALPEKAQIVTEISEELKDHKIEMLLIENTLKAAEHAAESGLIFTDTLPAIEEEKEKDKHGKADAKDVL